MDIKKNKEEPEDHRSISEKLELYIYKTNKKYKKSVISQGLPLLLENWVIVRNIISNIIRKEWLKHDFKEVITPVIGEENLYKLSGHLEHYREHMFPEIKVDKEKFFLRPMTCPHHCLIYKRKIVSYKDLPIKICENSLLHRYEPSGSLKGLERTRYMELVDHHIFVEEKRLKEIIKEMFLFSKKILDYLNFPIERIVCSLRDKTNKKNFYHNDEEIWKKSENIIEESLNEMNLNYLKQEGEAAFYGPKIDLETKTTDNKYITISTIQLDYHLPKKFTLNFIDKKKQKQTPVIVHHSPIGTFQRIIAMIFEKNSGKLPYFLAPIQVAIITLNEKLNAKEEEILLYAKNIKKTLVEQNIRTEIISKKSLNLRIKQVHERRIPFFILIGEKELEEKKIDVTRTYYYHTTTKKDEKKITTNLKVTEITDFLKIELKEPN